MTAGGHVCDPLLTAPDWSGGPRSVARVLRLLTAYLRNGTDASAGGPMLEQDLQSLLAEFIGCQKCSTAVIGGVAAVALSALRSDATRQDHTDTDVLAALDGQLAAVLDQLAREEPPP